MKVGDLVRWTGPPVAASADVGLITKVARHGGIIQPTPTQRTRVDSTHIFIQWMVVPEDSDWIAADHRYLELVNESR